MYLKDIKKNDYYIIEEINTDEKSKRRLYDIGLISGTKVKKLYTSPSKKINAYLIRNSMVAIRNKDAALIKVRCINDKNSFDR